jgi:zinc/manganese transport system substrate-binding protein
MKPFKQYWLMPVLLSMALPAQAIEVVTSFSVLTDLVQQVGGAHVKVHGLVGAGQDAHGFEPKPQDLKPLKSADLLVVNGLGFDVWAERLGKSSDFKGQMMIASKGLKALKMAEEHEDHDDHAVHDHHDHGELDPHAWQDPQSVQMYVKNITEALIKADPTHKADYDKQSKAYLERVQQLDQWARLHVNKVPKKHRKVLTSHDAFGYMANRYGIEFLALQGVSTESEPSAKNIAAIMDTVKKEQVKAIFLEHGVQDKLIKQLAKDLKLTVGQPLYSDSLTSSKGEAATWEAMFKLNVSRLVNAWGVQVQ